MKKTIWKFELEVVDYQRIEMPIGAEILSVQTQYGKPCIWVLVAPNNEKELRHFDIFGTGNVINFDRGIVPKFIGTFQMLDGKAVFHLFERV